MRNLFQEIQARDDELMARVQQEAEDLRRELALGHKFETFALEAMLSSKTIADASAKMAEHLKNDYSDDELRSLIAWTRGIQIEIPTRMELLRTALKRKQGLQ